MTRPALYRIIAVAFATVLLATACAGSSESSAIEIDAIRAESEAAILTARQEVEPQKPTLKIPLALLRKLS